MCTQVATWESISNKHEALEGFELEFICHGGCHATHLTITPISTPVLKLEILQCKFLRCCTQVTVEKMLQCDLLGGKKWSSSWSHTFTK